jgi:hypothetical protein
LRSIQFTDDWEPTIGPPPSTPQSAVVIGAGIQWKEVYSNAYSENKIVVGGASFVRLTRAGLSIYLLRSLRLWGQQEVGRSVEVIVRSNQS